MEIKVPRSVWIAGAALVIIAGGILAYGHVKGRQVAQAVSAAETFHATAATQAAQGAKYDADARAQDLKAQADAYRVQSDDAVVQALRGEVARMRRSVPGLDPAPTTPGNPDGPVPVSSPVDMAPLVAKQDALIQAQDHEIQDLKAQVVGLQAENHTLILARDAWKSSAENSAQEAVQLRAALAAKDGLMVAAKLKYGLGGLIIGYGAGRAHH